MEPQQFMHGRVVEARRAIIDGVACITRDCVTDAMTFIASKIYIIAQALINRSNLAEKESQE